MLGRLFEGLQQRVRRVGREHVHLVDEIHLVRCRETEAEVHALGECADVVDAVVRRRVELEEVEETTFCDAHAVVAHTAGVAVGCAIEAVERLGEDARAGGLARAARTGEEVGVADALVAHRVAQRGRDVRLTDHVGEPLWAVLAVERLVRHRRRL